MRETDIAHIAELTIASPYANPRPVTIDAVEAILRASWAGTQPDPMNQCSEQPLLG